MFEKVSPKAFVHHIMSFEIIRMRAEIIQCVLDTSMQRIDLYMDNN